jgi:hypothetical protein
MLPCRPVLSARAMGLATYPSWAAMERTCLTVSFFSMPGRLKARETVDVETFAAFATSLIVGGEEAPGNAIVFTLCDRYLSCRFYR